MIALYRQACAQVLRKPLALVAGFLGLLVVAGLAWWWLSMPVATMLNLALLASVSVVTPLLAVLLVWRAFVVFRRNRASGWRAAGQASFLVALMLALLTGVALPWALIQWVPEVSGLWGQLASMVVRWSVAGIVFVASLLWLAAVTRLVVESGDGDDIQPEERQADQTA